VPRSPTPRPSGCDGLARSRLQALDARRLPLHLAAEKVRISLSQLAERTGLTKAYLVRLENQGANPTLEALAAIADALEVTVADLIGAPKLTFEPDEIEIPPSLQAYADEYRLTSPDVRLLASMQWRKGERPRTPERWRFIHDSIRASRSFDPPGKNDGDQRNE